MSDVVACGGCGNSVPLRATVCPSCQTLVHAARLKAIATEAEACSRNGAYANEARLWRDALPLLPPDSKQYAAVAAKVEKAVAASGEAEKAAIAQGPPAGSRWAKILGPLGGAGLLIWKLKFLVVALLTNGKLLLIGLTKFSTIISALAFLGLYWKAWGWQFAAAVVLMIYIHEIGHVAALARRGLPATAPLFIPGVGAFVRLGSTPVTPSEDAKIGLAGPLWGFGVAIAAFALAIGTHSAYWRAVANTAALLNLFNLTPVWQLDGSRGFNALSRVQRWLVVALIVIAWLCVREGIIALVGLVAAWRAWQKNGPATPDWSAFAVYVFLLAGLTALVPFTAHH